MERLGQCLSRGIELPEVGLRTSLLHLEGEGKLPEKDPRNASTTPYNEHSDVIQGME